MMIAWNPRKNDKKPDVSVVKTARTTETKNVITARVNSVLLSLLLILHETLFILPLQFVVEPDRLLAVAPCYAEAILWNDATLASSP